jgi:hypothetical protein
MAFEDLYPGIGTLPPLRDGPPLSVARSLHLPTRGRKNTPAYNAHSYPTKVPPEAIEPFIRHHTRPGDLVLDPFCGSGMTGLAARRLRRQAVLNDLSYGAVHLAWNMVTSCDPAGLARAAAAVLAAVQPDYARWYGTTTAAGAQATIAWTLHSRNVACPVCSSPSSLWRDATDPARGVLAPSWSCPSCGATITRRSAQSLGSEPVLISVA